MKVDECGTLLLCIVQSWKPTELDNRGYSPPLLVLGCDCPVSQIFRKYSTFDMQSLSCTAESAVSNIAKKGMHLPVLCVYLNL